MSVARETTVIGRGRVLLAVLGAAELAAGIACFFGVPSWLILVLAPVPWVLVLRPRLGAVVGALAAILVSFWLLLVVMFLTPVLHVPVLAAVIVVLTLLALLGVVLSSRNEETLLRPSVSGITLWASSMLGGLIWLGVMLAAVVVPGAARYSWVMLGDSANNLLFARAVLDANGFVGGATANPTPLPSVLLATVFASGRDQVLPKGLLQHDIAAFDQVWALLIVLTCVTAGLVAGTLVRSRGGRPAVVGVVAAGASLLPLSWFFTGYSVEFGFLNASVAMPILFMSFIVYLGARRNPAIVLGLLCIAATLVFAVWDPLVLLVAALAVVVIITRWRPLITSRGLPLIVLLVGIVQLLVYGLGFVLPGLLHYSYFLVAGGGVFVFHHSMIVVLAVAAIALAWVAFARLRDPAVLGTVAIAIGSGAGLAALLFESRDQPSPWTYYPVKFAWLAATVIVLLIVGLAPAVVVRFARPIGVQLLCLAVIAGGTVAFLQWTPSASPGYVAKNPAARVLEGDVLGPGDILADKVFRLTDPDTLNVLWHTNDGTESTINFWTLQMWAGQSAGQSAKDSLHLKYAAYGLYGDKKIGVLCKIIGWADGTVNVYTAEPTLHTQLETACPVDKAHVIVKSP